MCFKRERVRIVPAVFVCGVFCCSCCGRRQTETYHLNVTDGHNASNEQIDTNDRRTILGGGVGFFLVVVACGVGHLICNHFVWNFVDENSEYSVVCLVDVWQEKNRSQ